VDGLRRAAGDKSLERIAPHLTLVPPVNVRQDELGAALSVIRQAAGGVPRSGLALALGPVGTFLPANPVLYLGVDGDLEGLMALRDRVFVAPLSRPLTFSFVPHVTLADESSPARIEAAGAALADYTRVVTIDRVHVLQEQAGRSWEPIADAAFGPAAVVGRGGLELELTRSQILDPEARAMLLTAGQDIGSDDSRATWPTGRRLVVTGRQNGVVVGVGAAWLGPDGGRVEVFVDPPQRRQGFGGHLLAAVEAGVAEGDWGCSGLVSRRGPAAFYGARSGYSKAIEL
jgi:2'-5' RNA ligase